jgi:beta-glucosidase
VAPPDSTPVPSADERVADLLGRMTTAEKIGQLVQLSAYHTGWEQVCAMVRRGAVGSLANVPTAAPPGSADSPVDLRQITELQRIAVEETRLGIPLLYGRDVIHGLRTVFPIPLAQAATWDEELVRRIAEYSAREAAAAGIHWTFAPMVDIARDPRWGRIAEGFGEDPYLCSTLARAAVAGYQGADPSASDRVLACAKHYVAYGGAEGGRDYNTVECTDNTLRNVYLPPFRAAVDAGVATVMSAFHEIGGEPVTASRYLLGRVLRDGLGFRGPVVSDADAVAQLVDHGVAADEEEAASLAFNAGVDVDMWSGCFAAHLAGLVGSGEVSGTRLEEATARVLHAKAMAGLLEQPYPDPDLAPSVILSDEHRRCARRAAVRSIVLLKNRNSVLPLSPGARRVAVLGPLAEDRHGLMGTWAPDGRVEDVVTVVEGVRAQLQSGKVRTSHGQADVMQVHARWADVAVLVVGECSCSSGEDNCVARLRLPPGQDELVRALRRMGTPLVVVVCAGRPLAIGDVAELADALLYAWHPGVEAGHAIADVLFGSENPSAKLPVSVPCSVGQVPIHYNAKRTGRFRQEWPRAYVDDAGTPLYPFGFGLSYTSFAYDDIRVEPGSIPTDGTAVVSAQVTNTGALSGEEVAQCYVRDCVASTTRPERELRGFTRVALSPGESARVEFPLGPEELGFYATDGRFRVEPGAFTVWVGGDCRATLQAEVRVE